MRLAGALTLIFFSRNHQGITTNPLYAVQGCISKYVFFGFIDGAGPYRNSFTS